MGVGAGLSMYVVVVQKFTFAISSPDEFLLIRRLLHAATLLLIYAVKLILASVSTIIKLALAENNNTRTKTRWVKYCTFSTQNTDTTVPVKSKWFCFHQNVPRVHEDTYSDPVFMQLLNILCKLS